ncbi:lysozyme C-like [Rhinophrynus dorsalis]
MKIYVVFILAAALVGNCWAISRCAVAEAIRNGGVIGIKGYTLGDYMCLVHHASAYDTSLHNSVSEYGIFQINSYWWCDDGRTPGRKNLCGIPCTRLLNSDITDDVRCLKRIVRDPNGLGAWSVWRNNCRGNDLSYYTGWC